MDQSSGAATKIHVASYDEEQEACDGMILQAELAIHQQQSHSQVPDFQDAMKSVLTSPASSQDAISGGVARDLGDAVHSQDPLPGLKEKLFEQTNSQTQLFANSRGSQVSLRSRSSGTTGQIIEKAHDQGYIARSKAIESHFSVKNAFTNSSKQI